MAATPLNKEAGDYLARARAVLGIFQEEFAPLLEAELNRGLTEGESPVGLKRTSVSNYEAGRRQVPAAVIFAAFKLTGLPIRDPEATRSMDERLRRIEQRLGLGTPGGTPLEVLPPEDDTPLQ